MTFFLNLIVQIFLNKVVLIINLLGPHRGSERHLFVKLKNIENIVLASTKMDTLIDTQNISTNLIK